MRKDDRMTVVERRFEARALAIHHFTYGGLPFVDRTAALAVAVDAEDEIAHLSQQLAGALTLLDDLADVLADVSHGVVPRDGSVVRDVLKRAVQHANAQGSNSGSNLSESTITNPQRNRL